MSQNGILIAINRHCTTLPFSLVFTGWNWINLIFWPARNKIFKWYLSVNNSEWLIHHQIRHFTTLSEESTCMRGRDAFRSKMFDYLKPRHLADSFTLNPSVQFTYKSINIMQRWVYHTMHMYTNLLLSFSIVICMTLKEGNHFQHIHHLLLLQKHYCFAFLFFF